MSITRLNLLLAVALAVVLATAAFSRTDRSRPNVEFLPDMKYSPTYTAYEPNPRLSAGRTLQPPVAGTIARGETVLHYAATPADALRAGVELANPFPAGSRDLPASQERGRRFYQTFCTACHGPQGLGDGPVAKRGFPPPPSLQTGKSVGMADGHLLHVLTYGQNSMPSVAPQLSIARRWDVINYVRTLQKPAAVANPPADATGTAPPAEASSSTNSRAGPKEP